MTNKEKIEKTDKIVYGAVTLTPTRLSALNIHGYGLSSREQDRSLQRLRKAGLVKNVIGPKGGWVRL